MTRRRDYLMTPTDAIPALFVHFFIRYFACMNSYTKHDLQKENIYIVAEFWLYYSDCRTVSKKQCQTKRDREKKARVILQ